MSKSLRYAILFAAGYCAVASAYIVFSGDIAAQFAHTVEDLHRIEQTKGILFVAVTTLFVFAGGLWTMRQLDRANDELRRRERLLVLNEGRAFAGLMAASVAHDVNNVLTSVLAELQDLAALLPTRDADPMQQVDAGVRRLIELNRRLGGAAQHSGRQDMVAADLATTVREAVAAFRMHDHVRGTSIRIEVPDGLRATTHPLLMHQILGNLLLNAGEATDCRGNVLVRVRMEGSRVAIEVHDDGPGIPKERWDGMFDRLQTTKPHGSGLGLFSVRVCAESLGGDAVVAASELGGACVRVRLPAVALVQTEAEPAVARG